MISYREILPSDAKLLLDWRTEPRIAAGFVEKLEYDIEKQEKWIYSCYHNPTCYHWIIRIDDVDVGYLRFHHYDNVQKTCRLGLYFGVESASIAYVTVLDDLLAFLFFTMGIEKVTSFVLVDNRSSNKFNIAYGFTRDEENDSYATRLVGKETNAYYLTKEHFIINRKIKKSSNGFPITLWTY